MKNKMKKGARRTCSKLHWLFEGRAWPLPRYTGSLKELHVPSYAGSLNDGLAPATYTGSLKDGPLPRYIGSLKERHVPRYTGSLKDVLASSSTFNLKEGPAPATPALRRTALFQVTLVH